MPKREKYHLTHNDEKDSWDLKKEGNQRATRSFDTKEEAVKKSPEIVRRQGLSQLKIHKQDGRIQEERTYGKDPEKYPG